MTRTDFADKVQKGTTRADRITEAKAWRLLWKKLQASEQAWGSRFT